MSLKDLVKEIRNPSIVVSDIDKVLRDGSKRGQYLMSYFRPSSVPHQCPKEMWYLMRNVLYSNPENEFAPDPQLSRIFDLGSSVHETIQNWLGVAGVLKGLWRCRFCRKLHSDEWSLLPDEWCECMVAKELFPEGKRKGKFPWKYVEVTVEDKEHKLKGHPDGIIVKSEKREYVLEIKTMNTFKFQKLREAEPGHVMQAGLYSYMLGIDNTVFLYYDKNSQNLKEFLVDTSISKHVLDTLSKIETVNEAVEKNIAPKGVCKAIFDARAVECTFKDVCFEKVSEKMFPDKGGTK